MTPLAALVIALAALAAYHNSFAGPFIYDDAPSIVDNRTIRHLWPPWQALSPPRGEGTTVEGRPVLNLSLAVNYAISGTDVWSYHALNFLIHLAAGLTLFGIARRTLERRESPARQPGSPRSFAACCWGLAIGLLWTVHPLQTEAVTYVIQRAESLMGLFYLLTLYCFIRAASEEATRMKSAEASRSGAKADRAPAFAEASAGEKTATHGSVVWFILSIVACLFGMGTKEVMVTAPVMIVMYDRAFVAGGFREAWNRRRGYYLALAATWALLAVLVAGTGGNRSGSSGFGTTSFHGYLLTQFPAVFRYLCLSVWPHPLIFEYGTFWVTAAQAAPYAIPVLVLAALSVWALIRAPALGFLGFWFFGILAPTSLIPGTTQMIVEHRMYLPLAAVIALAIVGLRALVAGGFRVRKAP